MREVLFDAYLFADYSGAASRAAQRKGIRLAFAERGGPALLDPRPFDRDELRQEVLRFLDESTRRGRRVCLGFDHSYGLPLSLQRELGIDKLPWRDRLAAFLDGTYGGGAPSFATVSDFAHEFNRWLVQSGGRDYFWSATKGQLYGIPTRDPRSGDGVYRETEIVLRRRGLSPKPFNRLGDNGSVGGQSLHGMRQLLWLLTDGDRMGIPIRVWPFDGPDPSAPPYVGAHVAIEPYPTALRPRHLERSDENDAACTVEALRQADEGGVLGGLLDLQAYGRESAVRGCAEGWIFAGVRSGQL